MKIRQIKEFYVLANKITVTYNKTHNGGSFALVEGQMEIGIKCMANDPVYTLSVISHEVMEMIMVLMGARLDNPRMASNYLFNFDHQTFENAIQLHTEIMSKFIYYA